MLREDLKKELYEVLYTFTKVKEIVINDEMDLVKDLKIKSAKLIDIALVFESRYNIDIDVEDMDEMFTVQAVFETLEKYLC